MVDCELCDFADDHNVGVIFAWHGGLYRVNTCQEHGAAVLALLGLSTEGPLDEIAETALKRTRVPPFCMTCFKARDGSDGKIYYRLPLLGQPQNVAFVACKKHMLELVLHFKAIV